ncbi:MAG TPA: arsenite methyltransferase [Gemmatimonadaceae bacterium]|nr:arsenite methyltransferase [Gemmatimonadaceae bacterium]
MIESELKQTIREKYGDAASRVQAGATSEGCCGTSACCGATTATWDPITANLYDDQQKAGLPVEAVLASLGCGNPTALAELKPGQVVLDLGSGGGIDVLLSAKRVGPTGKVYGLDMTDEMLALANENKQRAGVENVDFLKGDIEQVPLPDESVDVIISNCVINLSADKRKVLSEAFRVLKPGGRFAVSDVVVRGYVPDELRTSMELWIGCVAGALEEQEFIRLLREVGFAKPSIEPTRIYKAEDAAAFLSGTNLTALEIASQIDGKFMGAFVRASKPIAQCCGPDCC